MDAQDNKIEAFLSAIKELALEECKTIDDETESIRAARLKTLNKEARLRSKAYLEYEVARLRAELNSNFSKYEENDKRELTTLRNMLMEKVFFAVSQRLCEFTKTDDYKALLINSAKEISEELKGEEVELFIRQEDLKFKDEITEAFNGKCKISIDENIKIGGINAVCSKTKMQAEDTLDARLENQKSWFLEKSGLSI
ncbi:MAG: V-type ATP synthase subunit E family protein [Oscillospiraceae bacterium]